MGQLEISLENSLIEEAEVENSLYRWCIDNHAEYLLNEWDYEKNGAITPKTVTHGTDLKVMWILPYDDPKTGKHFDLSWSASVAHRKSGRGCPYISNPVKKILVGFNDLATTSPDLANEWDHEKNGDLTPQNVTSGSTRIACWICPKGHSYTAKIAERHRGNGCPICAGKQVLVGVNDLCTVMPEIAKDWDYERNGNLTPQKVTIGYTKKVYWKCAKNPLHQWYVSVNSRTNQHCGCPYCGNKKIIVGENDLATTHPHLLEEWDHEKNGGLTPQMVVAGNNKKVWWKCKTCHQSWEAVINHRALSGSQCPICVGQMIVPGYNDLPTKYPELMDEWDYEKNTISPVGLAPTSHEKAHWICKKGHSYYTSVASRTHMNTGCPVCAQPHQSSLSERLIAAYLQPYFSDILFNEHPAWLGGKELDIYIPSLKVAIEYDGGFYHKNVKKDVWKDEQCEKNGVMMIRVRDVLCPEYASSSIKISSPKADGSHNELHDVIMQIVAILNQRFGCKIPAIENWEEEFALLLAKVDQIEIENSIINESCFSDWDEVKNKGLNPKYISKGSHVEVYWKCHICGYSWKQAPYVRTGMKCGCPACAHQVVHNGNSFGDLYPDLLKEWNMEKNKGIDPFKILPKSNKEYWWTCSTCGYEWHTALHQRTSRGRGCPLCAHQALVAGVNDLATQFPEIASEWNYDKNELKPEQVSGGTNKRYWWKCKKCGYNWQAVVASRTKRGSGCPACGTRTAVQGYNDLATVCPELVKEWNYERNDDLKPERFTKGSNKKVWWKCGVCSYEWRTAILSRAVVGTGCKQCYYRSRRKKKAD